MSKHIIKGNFLGSGTQEICMSRGKDMKLLDFNGTCPNIQHMRAKNVRVEVVGKSNGKNL